VAFFVDDDFKYIWLSSAGVEADEEPEVLAEIPVHRKSSMRKKSRRGTEDHEQE
jgi:hypothetical protein